MIRTWRLAGPDAAFLRSHVATAYSLAFEPVVHHDWLVTRAKNLHRMDDALAKNAAVAETEGSEKGTI